MTDKIENQYNPEFDVIPGGPMVTWAEYELLQMVKQLTWRVAALERRIADNESDDAYLRDRGLLD